MEVHVSSLHKCNTIFFQSCFFSSRFFSRAANLSVAWTTSTPLDRFAVRLKKRLEKKLHDKQNCWLHLCKLETCTYISLAAIYGLTAITKILVAGWKYARFLCYSMGARWFLRFLGPKLELPSMSAYSPYLRCLWCCPRWQVSGCLVPTSRCHWAGLRQSETPGRELQADSQPQVEARWAQEKQQWSVLLSLYNLRLFIQKYCLTVILFLPW